MPKTEQWPLERFKPDEQELARHDDPEETRRMGLDMLANGQLQPVAATEDGRVIFGHGRFLGAKAVGIKMLEVKVYPKLDESQFILTRAAENLQRKELTGYRKFRLCAGLIELNGWDQKTLAEHLHLDPSNVTRLLSPSKCVPEALEALKAGKIGTGDCYALAKLNPEDQVGLLALKLSSGLSRDAMESAGRKKRAATAPAVRVPTIRVTLLNNISVVIKGEAIDLEQGIEALKDALKAMTKARDTGLNAATAQKVWRDMAAAG